MGAVKLLRSLNIKIIGDQDFFRDVTSNIGHKSALDKHMLFKYDIK